MGCITFCRSVEQEIFFQDGSWPKTEDEKRIIGQLNEVVRQANCLEKPEEICVGCTQKFYHSDFGMIRLRETIEGEWLDLTGPTGVENRISSPLGRIC